MMRRRDYGNSSSAKRRHREGDRIAELRGVLLGEGRRNSKMIRTLSLWIRALMIRSAKPSAWSLRIPLGCRPRAARYR